ncbi:MAG: hypothetical protein HZC42_02045 [Candidatus Eisenbacteria bacterium]|nr:hypothetical protein [Candidatus Eisenbacteria bacterium]
MDRTAVECSALGFQAVVTSLLALAFYGLWQRQRRPYFLTWALAWALYVARLGFISAYLVHRDEAWLFAHQAVTGMTSLLMLGAALQFAGGLAWRPRYLWLFAVTLAWAYVSIYVLHSMLVAGVTATVLLSGVTLWTGFVFFRHRRHVPSTATILLGWTFVLWGLHHLDYPLLRRFGTGVLYGVFADVLFIMAVALGTLFLVLGDERRKLAQRSAQLEQLTRLLLRTQEDERRRIARELHDEAGQVLTAVKIELDLDGRKEASEMVGRALAQVRDLSNLLRPTVLDDLGLLPALRGLIEDFARRSRIEASLETSGSARSFPPDVEVVIYRVVQEALTNVTRHAGARRVSVGLDVEDARVRLVVEDDGRGVEGEPTPHLGILGMRERITELGGTLVVGVRPAADGAAAGGFRIEAVIPTGEAT